MKGKLFTVVSLLLVLVVLFSFVGCKKATPTPTVTATPTPTPAKKYTFDFVSPLGAAHTVNTIFLDFANEIKERSGGQIVFTLRPVGELPYKGPEFLELLRDKMVDSNHVIGSYVEATEPLFGVPGYPMLFLSAKEGHDVLQKVIRPKIDAALAKKWNAVRIADFLWSGQPLWCSTKVITKLEDVKGMKIRSHGATWAVFIKDSLGAIPVTMPAADLYTALQLGTVDGCFTAITHAIASKVHEVSKSAIRAEAGFVYDAFCMRKDTWDGLPDNLKTLLKDSGNNLTEKWKDFMHGSIAESLWDTAKKAGVKVTELTPAERQEFRNKIEPMWAQWAKAGGPEAESLLTEILKARGG